MKNPKVIIKTEVYENQCSAANPWWSLNGEVQLFEIQMDPELLSSCKDPEDVFNRMLGWHSNSVIKYKYHSHSIELDTPIHLGTETDFRWHQLVD